MPAFPLCTPCLGLGYCRQLRTRLVDDAQLSSPAFIRDVRAYAHALKIGRDSWLSWLEDAYRDYPGLIVNAAGEPVFLDLSVFETASIRYWFRDFACTSCPSDAIPHVNGEAWERVRVFATLLRAVDPSGTAMWGVRPANDNAPPPSPWRPDLAACPHRERARFSPLAANDNKAPRSIRPNS